MKKITFLLLLLVSAISIHAQNGNENVTTICSMPDHSSDKVEKVDTIAEIQVYSTPEVMPQFEGGDMALFNFINKNLKYPVTTSHPPIEGRVIIRFIIQASGDITNIKIVRSLNENFDKEAIRLIESMPKWIPARQEGRNVAAYFTLPILFRIY